MLGAAALDDDDGDGDTEANVCSVACCCCCCYRRWSFNILTCVMFMCNSMRSYYRPIRTNEKCNLYVLKEIEAQRAQVKWKKKKQKKSLNNVAAASLAFRILLISVYTTRKPNNTISNRYSVSSHFGIKVTGFSFGGKLPKRRKNNNTQMEWHGRQLPSNILLWN